ncbi:MAG: ISAzo13 family transposase, partial [Gammaproteobacteria bacterium]|nr:ISAzo13 family transposase [Gammaproteobacteria bacterium]
MIIADTVVQILSSSSQRLTGAEKRRYMAEAVQSLGRGAQRACEKQLGWCGNTIRKGWHELQNGINCIDNFSARGRKRCEEKKPKLVAHIREIVEAS